MKHTEPKVWVRMLLQDDACNGVRTLFHSGTQHAEGSFAAGLLRELWKLEPGILREHRIVSEASA